MTESVGNNFILNGDLLPSDVFDNSLVYQGESVYEVIRMVRGYPVFFSDHIIRLETSVRMQGRRMIAGPRILRRDLVRLSESEDRREINLKIVFNYNGPSENYLIYFIEPQYPSEEQYREGVKGILFSAERENPESKVINHELRSSIYHRLIIEGAYEALLVNHHNCITEGSRSNIYFIKNDVLYTAPEKYILNGITRKHILRICDENRIKVVLSCVSADNIGEYDTVFMSGTSPIVLPFSQIDSVYLNTRHHLLGLIKDQYLLKADESIRLFSQE